MTTNSEATNGYTGAQLGIRKQNENRRAHEILQRRSNVRFLVETVVNYFLPVILEPPTSAITYFTLQEDRTAAMQNIVLLCCVYGHMLTSRLLYFVIWSPWYSGQRV